MVKVAFLHPDMGIGGAEQLVVNLAMLCKKNGWDPTIITPFYDPERAFEQTKNGNLKVEVHGNWFPRRICGKFQALCEYIRLFIASLYLIILGGKYDLVIVDQIPISVPLLRLRYRTFFYCHFPDKLLCTNQSGLIRKLYRRTMDLIEEICLLFASVIVVNSEFTQKVFKENFRLISKLRNAPKVLYPCSDLGLFDIKEITREDLLQIKGLEGLKKLKSDELNSAKFIVSLNRYERKKNLGLAVDSFIEFMTMYKEKEQKSNFYLIVAGGFDNRLSENIEVFTTLINKDFKSFKDRVFFLRSITNDTRTILLKNANLVLYTPKNEHFGIVPCESMYCGAPVIGHKSGGPLETIKPGVGFLKEDEDPKSWGLEMLKYFEGPEIKKDKLREYVASNFSLDKMNDDFLRILDLQWKGVFRQKLN